MTEQVEANAEEEPVPCREITGGHWRQRMRLMDEVYDAGESAGVTLTREEMREFISDCDPAAQDGRRWSDIIGGSLLRAVFRFTDSQEASSEAEVRKIYAAPTGPGESKRTPKATRGPAATEDPRLSKPVTELEDAFFMRRGMDGLAALLQATFGDDPFSGAVYLFRGRRGRLVKCFWHDGQGLCVFQKRLERGHFPWPVTNTGRISFAEQLATTRA